MGPLGAVKAVVTAVVALVLFLTPFAAECAVARFIARPHVLFWDLPFWLLLAVVTPAVVVAWRITKAEPMIVALWGWSAFMGVFNTVNRCNPGWCGAYGFPLPFFTWSDVIITFNGETRNPFTAGAAVFDALVLIAPFLVVSLRALTAKAR